jgi:hypothetical protein
MDQRACSNELILILLMSTSQDFLEEFLEKLGYLTLAILLH